MRIKLDENLPVALLETLRTYGHDVDTVADEDPGKKAVQAVRAFSALSDRPRTYSPVR